MKIILKKRNLNFRVCTSFKCFFMKYFAYILFLVLLISCKLKDNELKENLIGDWKYLNTISIKSQQLIAGKISLPPFIFYESKMGFTILDKDSCLYKQGFITSERDEINFERINIYLGNKTKYTIEDSTLKFYHLTQKKWMTSKIHLIKSDTLILEVSDSTYSTYIRTVQKDYDLNIVDRIIVSSTGCYGSCPISDISISSDGKIIYNGFKYNTKQGIFDAVISKKEYEQILYNFLKADFINLENSYQANHTDDECISVTFIKNDSIIKTIMDYGREAPGDFIQAYTPVRYLYQKLKLTERKKTHIFNLTHRISLLDKHQICDLEKSEAFFLFLELEKARPSNTNPALKYKIDLWNGEKYETLFTDGKIFKKTGISVDLGYNFFERNNIYKKFRNKYNWE